MPKQGRESLTNAGIVVRDWRTSRGVLAQGTFVGGSAMMRRSWVRAMVVTVAMVVTALVASGCDWANVGGPW
jgi:hypothetical protein